MEPHTAEGEEVEEEQEGNIDLGWRALLCLQSGDNGFIIRLPWGWKWSGGLSSFRVAARRRDDRVGQRQEVRQAPCFLFPF